MSSDERTVLVIPRCSRNGFVEGEITVWRTVISPSYMFLMCNKASVDPNSRLASIAIRLGYWLSIDVTAA